MFGCAECVSHSAGLLGSCRNAHQEKKVTVKEVFGLNARCHFDFDKEIQTGKCVTFLVPGLVCNVYCCSFLTHTTPVDTDHYRIKKAIFCKGELFTIK